MTEEQIQEIKKQGIIENTSKAGKASAEATKEKLTEEEYKLEMSRRGKLGGRPKAGL